MDLRARRELNRGLGDALSRAFEFAATLGICVVIGLFLDDRFGTMPWITIGLSIFCLVAQFVKLWYAYDAEMKRHEARHAAAVAGSPGSSVVVGAEVAA